MFERIRQNGWSIQAQFLLYSSALLIPALIFSGLMILRSASLERAAMEGEIDDVVRAVTTAIDRELAATTTTLNALASSPALTDGDFKAFYNQAIAVQEVSGSHVFLTSRSGKQLLSTRVAWGAELPPATSNDWNVVIETGKPQVSDVYRGSMAEGAPAFSISVPVKRGAKPIYVLSASISPNRILEILQQEDLDEGWVATVTDRAGTVVARSKDHEKHVGTLLAKDHWGGSEAHAGLWRATDADGEAVLRASSYSQQSGWLVSLSRALRRSPIGRSCTHGRSSQRWPSASRCCRRCSPSSSDARSPIRSGRWSKARAGSAAAKW